MNVQQAARLLPRIEPSDRLVMSPRPLARLHAVAQPAPTTSRYEGKPAGLWYACGGAWLDWVLAEMPQWLADYNYVYTLQLNPARMRMIRTARDFAEFEEDYHTGYNIDWHQVAQRYTGVEICPYQWSRRMAIGSEWYYTWDVASGCIWNPAAVRAITPVEL